MGIFDGFKKKNEPPPKPSERRIIPRWPVRIDTLVSWDGQQGVECTVENLNLKGLSITMPVRFPQSLVKLQLNFSAEFILSIDVMTSWYKSEGGKHQYGVIITRMRNDDRDRLYAFIRHNFPEIVEKRIKDDAH